MFLVRRKEGDGSLFAMKVLKKEELRKRSQVERTKTERRVLERMNSPFVVRLHYAFQSKRKLFLVLDYCPGGELFFYLQNIGRFKEETARFFAANVLLGLEALHREQIVYRDLKPENVLVCADGYAKITDFGLSKEQITGNHEANSLCGTPEYLAPEMLNRAGHGRAADWWSFGVIVYEMLTGLPAFYHKDRAKMYENIKHGEIKMQPWLSDDAKDLFRRLLV